MTGETKHNTWVGAKPKYVGLVINSCEGSDKQE